MIKKIFVGSLLLGCSALPLTAYANECDTHVIDSVGKANVNVLNEKAQSLISKGIEPRIRIIQNYGSYGNLDRYERAWVKRCSSMSSPDGGKKGNLLSIIFEMDNRQIGIYYGPDYHAPLDTKWKWVKDRTIIPKLKSGNFTGAVGGGMDKLGQIIYDYENPVVLTPEQIQAQKEQVVIKQKEIIALKQKRSESRAKMIKSTFKGFLYLLLIVGVGIIFYAVFSLLRKYLENRAQVAKAKNSLSESKAKLIQAINNSQLSDLKDLEEKVESLRDYLSDEDMNVVMRSWQDVRETSEKHMSSVEDISKLDDGEDEESIIQSQKKYNRLTHDINVHGVEIGHFEDYLYATKEVILGAEDALKELSSKLSDNASKCDDIVSQTGIDSKDCDSFLGKADNAFLSAKKALSKKQITRFEKSHSKAIELSDKALLEANTHKEVHDYVLSKKRSLPRVRSSVITKQESASVSFSNIKSQYATSSWDAFKGHGSQGEVLLGQSKNFYDKGIESLDNGDLKKAKKNLDSSEALLIEAKELFVDVIEIEKKIIKAEERSSVELRLAKQDIVKAERYIKENSKDIKNSFSKYLSDAKLALSRADAESKKSKSNYIIVVEKALEANEMADKILEQAMTEKQETKRKERLIKEQLKRAQDQIDTALRYHRSHRGDISSSAKRGLTQAQKDLLRALEINQNISTLDSILSIVKKANDRASSSINTAKRDVSSAESSRRAAERRRRQSSYSSSSSSSSSSYGGGGSSSWSSSSFGGSFGGGGSSGW